MSGPISVASSSGDRSRIASVSLREPEMNSSYSGRWISWTRSGAAVLPRVVEDRPEELSTHAVEVGVGEHDVRRLATELERHAR